MFTKVDITEYWVIFKTDNKCMFVGSMEDDIIKCPFSEDKKELLDEFAEELINADIKLSYIKEKKMDEYYENEIEYNILILSLKEIKEKLHNLF